MTPENTARFHTALDAPLSPAGIEALAAHLKSAGRRASVDDRLTLAGALARTAFLEPDRTGEIYDALTAGWRGTGVKAAPIATLQIPAEPAPDGLWQAYWAVIEDAQAGRLDALSITQRTAELGGMMPPAFTARVAQMSFAYPGVEAASTRALPAHVKLETLAACPPGSLGRQFHDLIVDNTFDLEVLDRDALGLSDLPKPLDYLNTRILQSHDLWHITAGYETTSLHEIALSAFQMAQFGHNYSAQFLSVVAAVSATLPATGYPVLMDSITSAWTHGRETPPMLAIAWEEEWTRSAEDIRRDYGIAQYVRPYRADIIERAQKATAFVDRIKQIVWPFRRKAQSA